MKRFIVLLALALVSDPAAAEFRGALVTKLRGEDQPVATSFYVSNYARTTFSKVEYDTDGFFDPEKPDTLTIPAGVERVKLQCQIIFEYNTAGHRQAVITKDNFFFPGFTAENKPAIAGTTTDLNISTPVLMVKAGDTFQCNAWQTQETPDAPAINIKGSNGVWFSIEVK